MVLLACFDLSFDPHLNSAVIDASPLHSFCLFYIRSFFSIFEVGLRNFQPIKIFRSKATAFLVTRVLIFSCVFLITLQNLILSHISNYFFWKKSYIFNFFSSTKKIFEKKVHISTGEVFCFLSFKKFVFKCLEKTAVETDLICNE